MNGPIDIKCLSVNIRGFKQSIKTPHRLQMATPQNCPFVFLQETYISNECENVWRAEWGGEIFYSHGTNHSKSTLILLNSKITCKVETQICDKNGRYIILDLVLADLQRIVLVNIYAPNDVNQQVSFFKELQEQLQEFFEETIIIGGNSNCTLSEIDKKGGNPNPRKQRVVEESNKQSKCYSFMISWLLERK